MSNTCETCQHWRKIRDEDLVLLDDVWPGPHGECWILDENSTDKLAWLAGLEGKRDEDISLITRPEFSCNQWQNTIQAESSHCGTNNSISSHPTDDITTFESDRGLRWSVEKKYV